MISILLLGFLLGIRHAIEADHIAAVASLTSSANSVRSGVQQGLVWGLGHTITLFVFGSIVLFIANIVPEEVASKLETLVGVMLIVLGADVIRRMVSERVHFHTHSHGEKEGDSGTHFHAHSHKGETKKQHDPASHQHRHVEGFPFRALLVGLMHGMAGSAALIILTLQSLSSPWLGLVYIFIFGIGSIAGMGLFSLVIAVPMRAAKRLTWVYNSLQAIIGVFTIGLGVMTVMRPL